VPVLPPDVNRSSLAFTVEPCGVRFGLGAVKGAGEGAIQSVLETRKAMGGRIKSLFELVEQVDLRLTNKKVFEALIKAGACDTLSTDERETHLAWRARMLAGLDRLLDHGARHQRSLEQGQNLLFGGDHMPGMAESASSLPAATPLTETEALTFEKEALGLYMSGHPLTRYAEALASVGARPLATLAHSEADVNIGGVVTGLRLVKTRRGDRMAVFVLEDEEGKVETVVYPEAYTRYAAIVTADAMVMVRGKFERDEETSRLVAAEITSLEAVRERAVREVEITLTGSKMGKDAMRRLADVLERHPGDRRVSFIVRVNGDGSALRVRTATARRIRPSDTFVRDVEALCGAGSVLLK
jgi:DNA polymerase-3 subunit alpha